MKSIAPETLDRLVCIAAGNAGSQGEISLRTPDFDELKEASSGAVLKGLESVDASSRVVIIPVPLLTRALQEVAPSVLSIGDADVTATKKSGSRR